MDLPKFSNDFDKQKNDEYVHLLLGIRIILSL